MKVANGLVSSDVIRLVLIVKSATVESYEKPNGAVLAAQPEKEGDKF